MPTRDRREDERVLPAHRVAAVGADAVGDADERQRQPRGEGEVAAPVDPGDGPLRPARAASSTTRPSRTRPTGTLITNTSRQSYRASSPPAISPTNVPASPTTWFSPSARPALLLGERVREERRGVRHQHRAAERLQHPQPDQLERAGRAGAPDEREQDRGDREDEEAEVVHPHPPEHVAQPAQVHDEHGRHDHVAHQHPEQIVEVARPPAGRGGSRGRSPAARSSRSTCSASPSASPASCSRARPSGSPARPTARAPDPGGGA